MEKIYSAINSIAAKLSVPKGKTNKFGGYKYRDLPTLRNALKQLLNEFQVFINFETSIDRQENLNDILIMRATCLSIEDGSKISSEIAIYLDNHKGMSREQSSGAALSYCEKYLLGQIFHIDDDSDTNDPDSNEVQQADKEAAEKELQNALTALSKAANNEEINSIVKQYPSLWKNSNFVNAAKQAREKYK